MNRLVAELINSHLSLKSNQPDQQNPHLQRLQNLLSRKRIKITNGVSTPIHPNTLFSIWSALQYILYRLIDVISEDGRTPLGAAPCSARLTCRAAKPARWWNCSEIKKPTDGDIEEAGSGHRDVELAELPA